MLRHRPVCNLFLCVYKPRLAIGLWSDANGTWYMNWSPDTSSTRVDCAFGLPGDVPLGGIGSDWRNSYSSQPASKMAFFRSDSWNGSGQLYRQDSTTSSCAGTQHPPVSFSGSMPRSQVFVVRDMNSDYLPDVLVMDPDNAAVRCYHSPNFTTYTTFDLGDQRSIVL